MAKKSNGAKNLGAPTRVDGFIPNKVKNLPANPDTQPETTVPQEPNKDPATQ